VGKRKDQVTDVWSDPEPRPTVDREPEVVVFEATEAGITGDPEIDALVDDIAGTRNEMTGTVEEIGDRLDPRHVLAQARENVRDATIGKVESMATTATEVVNNAGQAAQDAGTGVVDTIRRNPLPAAMIGIGLTWLLMSNRSSRTWETVDDRTYDTTYRAGYAGGSVTDRVGQAAGETVGQVQEKAGQLAEQVQTKASQVPDVARQVQDGATRVAQDNPLAVGAIALAVGTAIGMALPATKSEREVMGQARDSLIGRAEDVASEAMTKVEESARQR
jgi:ElaB/YqjD/DUF883 family membrane-anchored ribosome-binding protein